MGADSPYHFLPSINPLLPHPRYQISNSHPFLTKWWDFLTPFYFSLRIRWTPSQTWWHILKKSSIPMLGTCRRKAGVPGIPVWKPWRSDWPRKNKLIDLFHPVPDPKRYRGWGGLDPRNRALSGFHLPWLVSHTAPAGRARRRRPRSTDGLKDQEHSN